MENLVKKSRKKPTVKSSQMHWEILVNEESRYLVVYKILRYSKEILKLCSQGSKTSHLGTDNLLHTLMGSILNIALILVLQIH